MPVPSWCTVVPLSGSGSGSFSVVPNDDWYANVPRTGTFSVVTSGVASTSQVFSVSQDGTFFVNQNRTFSGTQAKTFNVDLDPQGITLFLGNQLDTTQYLYSNVGNTSGGTNYELLIQLPTNIPNQFYSTTIVTASGTSGNLSYPTISSVGEVTLTGTGSEYRIRPNGGNGITGSFAFNVSINFDANTDVSNRSGSINMYAVQSGGSVGSTTSKLLATWTLTQATVPADTLTLSTNSANFNMGVGSQVGTVYVTVESNTGWSAS